MSSEEALQMLDAAFLTNLLHLEARVASALQQGTPPLASLFTVQDFIQSDLVEKS